LSRTAPLREPSYSLPRLKSGLFVERCVGKHKPLKMWKYCFDGNSKAARRWGETYRDSIEKEACRRKLSQDELMRIDAGPTEIEFGAILAKERYEKTFWVKNGTALPISVQLVEPRCELSESDLQMQVIPAGQRGGFAIVLRNIHTSHFEDVVEYRLNGLLNFSFRVSADLIPLRLKANREVLRFTVAGSGQLTLAERLVISNPNSRTVPFTLRVSHPAFTTNFEEGVLEPAESKEVMVSFLTHLADQKDSDSRVTQQLHIQATCGNDTVVELTAVLPEVRLALPASITLELPEFERFFSIQAVLENKLQNPVPVEV
jgi:hypothetical protein